MTEYPERSDGEAYEIRVRGHLDARWAPQLGVPGLTHEGGGITVLRSGAIDQPALHGLLQRLRDLGLPLVSVARIDPEHPSL